MFGEDNKLCYLLHLNNSLKSRIIRCLKLIQKYNRTKISRFRTVLSVGIKKKILHWLFGDSMNIFYQLVI